MALIRKSMQFTEKLVANLEEIRVKNGLPSSTATVQFCIIQTYKNEFKDYVMAKKGNTAEGKAESEEVVKQATTDANTALCVKLGGDVSIDNNGAMVCNYYTYNKKNRYEQKVSLNSLTEDLLTRQFFPDKETVEQLQKEGKVNY